MNLWQGALTALDSVLANKLRSLLTVLGIVIGVGAVIALVSIGRGAQAQITAQIQSIGTNLVFVRPGGFQGPGGANAGGGSAATLTQADGEALLSAPGVAAVAPEVSGRGQVTYLGQNTNTSVVGVTPDYLAALNFQLADGEFVSEANVVARSSVVVLGSAVADTLFGGPGGVVGQSVRISGQPFRVIGVLASKGGTGFGNQDDRVLVPLTTAQTRLTGNNRFRGANVISVINVMVDSPNNVEPAIASITEILRERHGTYEGADDFTVQNQQDILSTVTQVADTLTIFLGGIAGISLLVGGIGIMNIMLVSVTERTREIGIRKALGARGRDILYQFLIEAAALSLTGGVIGITLGWGVSQLIGQVRLGNSTITPVVGLDAVLLATGFSIAIGLFFGIYPASRAAALEPVEALRYE